MRTLFNRRSLATVLALGALASAAPLSMAAASTGPVAFSPVVTERAVAGVVAQGSTEGLVREARRGADDGAGDDHGRRGGRGRGADDGAGHDVGDDHGGRRERERGDDRGRGRGSDDGAGHDAGDDHGRGHGRGRGSDD